MATTCTFGPLARLCGAAWMLTLSLSAGATAVTAIDEFVIVRAPAVQGQTETYEGRPLFYRDSFGDGAVPPAGGTFFTGAKGTYNVLGSYPANAESAGRLALDSSLGGAFTNASGGSRTLQRSVLLTDVDATTQAGLKRDFHTFSVFGLFDLTIPPVPRDGYGIVVNDSSPQGRTESIDLFVRHEENGNLVIRFQEQDFLNGVVNTLELDMLEVPVGADQIELQLGRGDLETNALTASYRYWADGAVVSPFVAMTAQADFFTTNGAARAGYFAVEGIGAAPEPNSLVLLLGGVFALAVATQRRRPGLRR
jgi:hypothetical protein